MPRPLSIAIIATLCFTFTARAEDKPSPAAKKILEKAVAKVKTNRQEFDKANKKPLDEARAELQELAKKLVDDGKAQEATSVLKQVGTLDADVLKMANAPVPVAGGGAVPQKPLLERMAGKWRRGGNNDVFVIGPDGFVQISNGDQGKLLLMSPEVAEVVLKSGWKLRVLMAQEDIACALEWDPRGRQTQGFVLEQMK